MTGRRARPAHACDVALNRRNASRVPRACRVSGIVARFTEADKERRRDARCLATRNWTSARPCAASMATHALLIHGLAIVYRRFPAGDPPGCRCLRGDVLPAYCGVTTWRTSLDACSVSGRYAPGLDKASLTLVAYEDGANGLSPDGLPLHPE